MSFPFIPQVVRVDDFHFHKRQKTKIINLDNLRDEGKRHIFQLKLTNRFSLLEKEKDKESEEEDIEEGRKRWKNAVNEAAEKVLGYKRGSKK